METMDPSPKENLICEGRAKVISTSNVFYNPVQEFNRDMSVCALSVFAEDFVKNHGNKVAVKRCHNDKNVDDSNQSSSNSGIIVLEALAATGLRSIRYAREVTNIKSIYSNDCSLHAVENMKQNITLNNVDHLVNAVNHDAIWLMQKLHFENKPVHAIDLDPYGCPTKFLDSTVNCISDGGLLMITCTDMAVIAGNTPETCYLKYGAVSLRSPACHEMALRIALHCVASHCGRYGRYILPLLSFSADFYIRIFLQVFTGQNKCKQISSNLSMVYQCSGCNMTTLQPLGVKTQVKENWKYSLPSGPPVGQNCTHCTHKHKIGGPIWSGKLHDVDFVKKMILNSTSNNYSTYKRMFGMLSLITQELEDVPLYYTVDALCSKIHCEMIPLIAFRSALLNGGYLVSLSHCKSNSVKTNAPQNIIWDIIRCWVKTHPVSEKRLTACKATAEILKVEPSFIANFTFIKGAEVETGFVRYQQNPLPNWGPGMRSKVNTLDASKKHKNQNKKDRLTRNNLNVIDEDNISKDSC